MRILLTNDDGIAGRGLMSLKAALSMDHEVWICAPSCERSACSHSITLRGPIVVRKKGERSFMCDGTPADCVLVAIKGLITEPVDLVISGINAGPNLGTDIIYSGTVAGARQGALMGIPSLAASLCSRDASACYDEPAGFISRNAETFCRLWSNDHFLNINFPAVSGNGMEAAITFPSIRNYRDVLQTFNGPDDALYCFFMGGEPETPLQKWSDDYTVKKGMISISPVDIHPGNGCSLQRYRMTEFWKGGGDG
ncbi:MAG: 5'/3'-nucleotidase SurE [Spirochaetales bacterium]|nr:5'/3'-nucleotidase SurE [Spirochaetales bacterium]